MNKCKIVEDLIPGYCDNILNDESKNFVEEHIRDCKKCSSKIEEYKKIETEENINTEQINYFKKINRKNNIKVVLGVVIIILIAMLGNYLYNFTIMYNYKKNYEQISNADNYYFERRENTNYGVSIIKVWKKGDKLKTEEGIYENTDDNYHLYKTKYETIGSNESVEIDENEKKVTYVTNKRITLNNPLDGVYPNLGVPLDMNGNILFQLGTPFYGKVEGTSRNGSNREYYIIRYGETTLYVHKDTFIPWKTMGETSGKSFYPNSNDVVKSEFIGTNYYIYNANTVTDEDVSIPNLDEYEKVDEEMEF